MRLDEASRRGQQRMEITSGAPSSITWRGRRAGIFSAARLALLRASHSRWLLLVVAIGILVADVLICTVPLYNTLVSDIQLQNTIASSDSLARNMQVAVRTQNISQPVSRQIDTVVRQQAMGYLTNFSSPQPTVYTTSGVMELNQAGSHTFGGVGNFAEARMETFDYTALRPYVRFIAGAPPETREAGKPIQVMVTNEMAKDWNLKVGQTVVVAALGNSQNAVTGVISGIFEPINSNDPFWNGLSFAIDRSDALPPVYPVLTTAESFFAAFGSFDGVGMTQTWVYYADLTKITTSNMADINNWIVSFRSYLTGNIQDIAGVANVATQGSLDQIVQGVQQQLNLIALPLYVIAAQIVGLALLFVAAMAGLLIEHQSQEIATLKSRGTSGVQLLGIFGTQSALLGLLAVIAAPFLAAGLALALIRYFLPGATASGAQVGADYFAKVSSPSLVIFPAIIGGVLGVAVVTFSALQAARLDVLAFRREMGRPSRKPFWRRMYLDVGLALLCIIGYLELGQFGGTQTRVQLGSQGNSPLLLITPALLLLSGGLLLLRLIPLAASLGARIASRGQGLTSMLAFAQIERTPGRYSRMTLLLVLAVGLGLFALTFDASLKQNVHDRAAYAAGADLRMMVNPQISVKREDGYISRLEGLPGVEHATPLYRTYGSTSPNLGSLAVDMLGVDSPTFATVADPVSWRSDYAAQSLPDLMSQMQAHRMQAQSGTVAPTPAWAIISQTFADQLRLKVGYRFQLAVSDIPFATPTFVVGAIVQDFPTLYPSASPGGFIVLDLRDLETVITTNSQPGGTVGPNEFWLRTTSSAAQHAALLKELDRNQFDLSLNSVHSFREDLLRAQSNPVNGGMSGLLLIGALTAALLAVLGSVVQAVMAARQRTTQFAIFRTLGMASRQLTGLLLGEQAVVYIFGLIGGTILGLILTTATWPFLTFSDSAVDPSKVGVPAYVLRFNWQAVGIFYGALLVAFVLALTIAARYAATIGLGKALRLGED
jgi:ABC-type lipoprotein release transport system permease subunit